MSRTVSRACGQLRTRGSQYLAQLTGAHRERPGEVGLLCAQLVDLWIDGDARAGAGVGVTMTAPPPSRCFSGMGATFAEFSEPGQLEGLLCAVEDYRGLAREVRRLVWSSL